MGLIGLDKALRAFDNIESSVNKSVQKSFHDIGKEGKKLLQTETPVDTGRLKASYTYTFGGKVYDKPRFKEDAVFVSQSERKMFLGTNTPYSATVEYLARNGSAGYFYRGSKKVINYAKKEFGTEIKRGLKRDIKRV